MISIIKIHNSFSVFDKRHLIHHLSFFVPYHMFDICTYGVRRVRARTFSLRCARTRREQRGDGHSRMIDVHGRERVFDRSSRFLLQSLYSHSASTTFVLSVKLLKRKGGGAKEKNQSLYAPRLHRRSNIKHQGRQGCNSTLRNGISHLYLHLRDRERETNCFRTKVIGFSLFVKLLLCYILPRCDKPRRISSSATFTLAERFFVVVESSICSKVSTTF